MKIDSTKKICKKLPGAAAGMATWVTNIGNEHGEVLMSVATESERAGVIKEHGRWPNEAVGLFSITDINV